MLPFLPAPSPWTDGTTVRSRSISAENPTGAPGAGGTVASPLGAGRKGRPYVPIDAGETITLADIDGCGRITHIWITVPDRTEFGPFVLRDLVLRAYWDGADDAAVEVPLGDFFANGFGRRTAVSSSLVVVAATGGMNCYLPMPFADHARLTLTSEHPGRVEAVFFQVDHERYDRPIHQPYLHAQWRRTDAGIAGADHVILDGVVGSGAYVGTYLGVAALQRFWWGEGEVKFFIDADTTHPTICGTGLEDYAGGAWGFVEPERATGAPQIQTYSSPFLGYLRHVTTAGDGGPYAADAVAQHGIYRWHVPDPVYFQTGLRVTVQQIGHDGERLFERRDDLCSVAFWYQDQPSHGPTELPPAPGRRPR